MKNGIEAKPRFKLAHLPTPLHDLPNLREHLGGDRRCPKILIKRDDLTGLAFGGNKARKLEFLVGDALRHDATVLVTSGAVQSNHARMTVAAACAARMKCALILTAETEHPETQGNLLLDKLMGAEIHWIRPNTNPLLAVGDEEAAKIDEVMDALRQRGDRPYLIPVGGSGPIGVFGYVTGTLELVTQLLAMRESPRKLYYGNGSRGTQAGLALGAKMYSAPYQLAGIAVSGGEPEKTQRALRIANQAAELLETSTRLTEEDLPNDEAYIGTGYAIATEACIEAITLLARTEGIFLDPVYSGKAMAGMIDHIRKGLYDPSDSIVFLHTGGTPALFAYTGDFKFD